MTSRMSPTTEKVANQIHAFAMQITQSLADDEYLEAVACAITLLNASLASDSVAIAAKTPPLP